MKILYPSGEASKDEIKELLHFSVEGRKRVKDQLLRLDTTYADVQFSYWDSAKKAAAVKTLEEEQYPQYYWIKGKPGSPASSDEPKEPPVAESIPVAEKTIEEPTEKHLTFQENQRGVSFNMLLGPYLTGATKIVVTDPYIRMFFQARNLMEFLETVANNKQDEDEVAVHLITVEDEFKGPQQIEYFQKMQESCVTAGIRFTWEFDTGNTLHARHVVTDKGWKILLDRGLDIFQHYEMNDAFAISNRIQKYRSCKAFEITYLRSCDV